MRSTLKHKFKCWSTIFFLLVSERVQKQKIDALRTKQQWKFLLSRRRNSKAPDNVHRMEFNDMHDRKNINTIDGVRAKKNPMQRNDKIRFTTSTLLNEFLCCAREHTIFQSKFNFIWFNTENITPLTCRLLPMWRGSCCCACLFCCCCCCDYFFPLVASLSDSEIIASPTDKSDKRDLEKPSDKARIFGSSLSTRTALVLN